MMYNVYPYLESLVCICTGCLRKIHIDILYDLTHQKHISIVLETELDALERQEVKVIGADRNRTCDPLGQAQ